MAPIDEQQAIHDFVRAFERMINVSEDNYVKLYSTDVRERTLQEAAVEEIEIESNDDPNIEVINQRRQKLILRLELARCAGILPTAFACCGYIHGKGAAHRHLHLCMNALIADMVEADTDKRIDIDLLERVFSTLRATFLESDTKLDEQLLDYLGEQAKTDKQLNDGIRPDPPASDHV